MTPFDESPVMPFFRRMSLKFYGLAALLLLVLAGVGIYALRPGAGAQAPGTDVSRAAAAPAVGAPAAAGMGTAKAALTVSTVLVKPVDLAQNFSANGGVYAWQEADVGADHPQALSQRLTYGVLLLQLDPQAAAPVLVAYYEAAMNGLVPPDDWAVAAGLLGPRRAAAAPPHRLRAP
jgi:hypothetical protein